MPDQTISEKQLWPTLEGRLTHALRTREDAIRQLETTMPISPIARDILKASGNTSAYKRKPTVK